MEDECLQTHPCEVEAILNGRPITTAVNDLNDALTPNTPSSCLVTRAATHIEAGNKLNMCQTNFEEVNQRF